MILWFVIALFVGNLTDEPAQDRPKAELPKDTLADQIPLDRIPLGLRSGQRDWRRPTSGQVQLGRKLFFDPILSANGEVSCASCHKPDNGFTVPTQFAIGINGKRGRRNPPSILNRGLGESFFWDGRAATLQQQALLPIKSEIELGSNVAAVLARLQNNPEYVRLFEAEFSNGISASNLAEALSSFERALNVGDTRIDRFQAGLPVALDPSEKQGLWIFESKGRCWKCHAGPNYSDEKFHNTGVGWGKQPLDLGRYEVSRKDQDQGKFKTPGLRAVTHTAPYMHDGSIRTLREVLEFYNKGGGKNPYLDREIEPLKLTDRDLAHLESFLKALSELPDWLPNQ